MAVLGCSRFTVQALATEEEAPGPGAFPPAAELFAFQMPLTGGELGSWWDRSGPPAGIPGVKGGQSAGDSHQDQPGMPGSSAGA